MKPTQILVSTSLILSLLVALPLLGGQVTAAPPQVAGLAQGDDFLISRTEGWTRANAAVAYNDDLDQYLVVWVDDRLGGLYWDIFGQFVSISGAPLGENFVVRGEMSNAMTYPDVAYDTNNQRYLVVWSDFNEVDVEGQLLNSDGSDYGGAINISEGTESDFRGFPAVAFDPLNDKYLVVYQAGWTDANIYGRTVDATGTLQEPEHIISDAAGDQTDPDVSMAPDYWFLVVWEDERSGLDEIWGAFGSHDGFVTADFLISSNPTNPRYNPAVAYSPHAGAYGEWLVVFEREVSGDDQIAAQRVAANGALIGGVIGICNDSGDQEAPDVAYNPAGSGQWLVIWEDERAGTANHDIYGRRVDLNGDILGDTFAISNPPGHQMFPAIAASGGSYGYLVVFSDDRTYDISAQWVATNGTPQGPALTVSAPLGQQRQAAAAYNSQDSEYLVVWHDQRANQWDIYGQLLDLDGTFLGPTFAICSDVNNQLNPSVAYNPDTNHYLVVWDDRRNDDGDIYGQLVHANGSLDGDHVVIADSAVTGRHVPRLAYNPITDQFFVVYMYEAENNNIRGRRLSDAGDPLGDEIDIATGVTNQNFPDVACQSLEPGGGGYLVVWRDTDGAQQDIQGQRLDQWGVPLGGLDVCTQASSQWTPAVAYSPDDDRYLVVWPDDRDGATQGRNLYGRQVSGAGSLLPEFAISTASDNQAVAAVTYASGLGNYIVAWEDTRNASSPPDLYGQRMRGTGGLVDTAAGSNDPLHTGPGGQESPAVVWAGGAAEGLLVWHDDRNGESDHIYGLRLSAAVSRIFLPLVVKED